MQLEQLSPAVRAHLIELRTSAGQAEVDAPLRVARNADDLMLVVAGGVGVKAAYLPTWSGSTRAVSRTLRAHA